MMIDVSRWADRLNWLFRLQFVVALIIVTYGMLSPDPIVAKVGDDKLLHFVGNILFFLSTRLALLRVRNVWIVLGFVFFYGLAMEFAQILIPQRDFDPMDMVASALGVAAGLVITLGIQGLLIRLQVVPVSSNDRDLQ